MQEADRASGSCARRIPPSSTSWIAGSSRSSSKTARLPVATVMAAVQLPREPVGGRADVEQQRVAVAHQLGAAPRDRVLLLDANGRHVAERLVLAGGGDRAAVDARRAPPTLQLDRSRRTVAWLTPRRPRAPSPPPAPPFAAPARSARAAPERAWRDAICTVDQGQADSCTTLRDCARRQGQDPRCQAIEVPFCSDLSASGRTSGPPGQRMHPTRPHRSSS